MSPMDNRAAGRFRGVIGWLPEPLIGIGQLQRRRRLARPAIPSRARTPGAGMRETWKVIRGRAPGRQRTRPPGSPSARTGKSVLPIRSCADPADASDEPHGGNHCSRSGHAPRAPRAAHQARARGGKTSGSRLIFFTKSPRAQAPILLIGPRHRGPPSRFAGFARHGPRAPPGCQRPTAVPGTIREESRGRLLGGRRTPARIPHADKPGASGWRWRVPAVTASATAPVRVSCLSTIADLLTILRCWSEIRQSTHAGGAIGCVHDDQYAFAPIG
jgi:hypothetical protein